MPRHFWGAVAIATALVAITISASTAQAATTRAEYVAQVDPICQTGQAQEAVALQPMLRAGKRAQRHHKLKSKKTQKQLARLFTRFMAQYTAIERQINDQIAVVPPAPDDVSLIQVWLRARNELIDVETRLFAKKPHVGHGLKGLGRFFTDFFTLTARQLEVTDLVRDFGFQYCTSEAEVEVIGDVSPPT
jgi:hypothetical protein